MFGATIFGIPILVILVVALLIIVVGPSIAITLSPELMLLFQIIAAIMIISWVRNTIGPGVLSLAISGILLYIFVFLLPQLTLSLWIVYMIIGLGIWQMLFWGLTILPGWFGGGKQ